MKLVIIFTLLFCFNLFSEKTDKIIEDLNDLLNNGVSIPENILNEKEDSKNYTLLNIGKNSIRKVMSTLAFLCNINIFFDEAVPDKKVQLIVKDLEPKRALKFIAKTNGLKLKYVDKHNVLVYPVQKEKNYSDKSIFKVFKLKNIEAKSLLTIIKSIYKDVRINYNSDTNSLVVLAQSKLMKDIELLIKKLDRRNPQLMLDVKLVEVKTGTLDKLGVNFSDPLAVVSFADYHPVNDRDTIRIASPDMLFEALNKDGRAKVLAKPKIILMNGEKAKIRIGDRIPVEIISTEVSEGINRQNNRIEWIDSGIKMEAQLLRFISNDEAIIRVVTEVSTPVTSITNTKSNIPQLRTREADTKLRVKNGETIVLGGLISKKELYERSNFLGKLPIIGKLFNRRKREYENTEIIIFITPSFLE